MHTNVPTHFHIVSVQAHTRTQTHARTHTHTHTHTQETLLQEHAVELDKFTTEEMKLLEYISAVYGEETPRGRYESYKVLTEVVAAVSIAHLCGYCSYRARIHFLHVCVCVCFVYTCMMSYGSS